MKNKKQEQEGWALVSVLLMSALMLSVTGLIVSKTMISSKELVRSSNLNKTDAIMDGINANVLNWINEKSWNNGSPSVTLNGIDFIKDLYNNSSSNLLTSNNDAKLSVNTSSFIDSSLQTSGQLDPFQNYYLYDFLNNKTDRTTNFLTSGGISFMDAAVKDKAKFVSLFINKPSGKLGINELSEKIYRKFNIEYGEGQDRIKAEARVSVIPVSTNINGLSEKEMHDNANGTNISLIPPHEDIYKMTTKICIPSCTNSNNVKKIEMLLSRPIVIGGTIPPYAVYADGTIDLQNKDTASATGFLLNDTHEGDVHSNSDVLIGSKGYVSGKVTSAGVVNANGTIVPDSGIPATGHALSNTSLIHNKSESKSHVSEIPKPDWQFNTTGLPPCDSTIGWSKKPRVIKDCTISISHSLSGEEHFEGTVYIKGNLASKGGDAFAARGTTPVKVIVDGTIDLGGNSDGLSTQEVIFVSNSTATPAIKIAGNPGTGVDTGAVFYTTKSESSIQVSGNVSFFGAIIASGTVDTNGNSGIIKRDTDLSALARTFPPSRKDLMVKVISWKDVKPE